MKTIDIFLFTKIDRITTWWQRKGGCLAQWHAFVWLAFIASSWVTGSPKVSLWIAILIHAVALVEATVIFSHEEGYQDDNRKTLRLNAGVVRARDSHTARIMMLIFVVLYLALPPWELSGTIFGLMTIILQYNTTSTFLGPGEHSREKRTALSPHHRSASG